MNGEKEREKEKELLLASCSFTRSISGGERDFDSRANLYWESGKSHSPGDGQE